MKWSIKKIIIFVVIDMIVIFGIIMYSTTSSDNSKKNSLQKKPSIIFNDVSAKAINLDTSTNTLLLFVTPSCDNCKHVLDEISNNKINYRHLNIIFIMPSGISEIQSLKFNFPQIAALNSYFVSDSGMVLKEHFQVSSYPTSFFYKNNKLKIKINGEFKSSYLEKYF